MDWHDPTCYAVKILDAKYEKVSKDEVVEQLNHLSLQQKKDLKEVMKDFEKLFNGTLSMYPHKKFHIKLIPEAKTKHARPYPIPIIHLEAFKKRTPSPSGHRSVICTRYK